MRALFSLNRFRRIKLDAASVQRQYEALGRPLENIPVVHVAGTNGKGSVCWKVAAALRAAGLRTGLFVSPHVSSFRERIRVDGDLIAEDAVTDLIPSVHARFLSSGLQPSFFEVVTMAAAEHFRDQRCDAAVIETGLGGRLDATTAFDADICAITAIGHDHAHILGSTLPTIAREKAGIARPGVPLVVAPMPGYVENVIRTIAARVGAPCSSVGQGPFRDFDDENSAVAALTLRTAREALPASPFAAVRDEHIAAGLAVRPPCRDERFRVGPGGAVVVLDAAHNEHGLRAILRRVRRSWEPAPPPVSLRVVFGAAKDKDAAAAGRALADACAPASSLRLDAVHVVQAAHPRAAAAAAVARALTAGLGHRVAVHEGRGSVARGVRAALGLPQDGASSLLCAPLADEEAVRAGREVTLVCGSLFLMPEARAAIGIAEPRDGDEVVGATTDERLRDAGRLA